MVSGTFLAVGGPSSAASSTQRGWITLSTDGRTVAHVRVPQDGRYAFGALPGRYQLSGLTPQFNVDGHQAPCEAGHVVAVRAGKTTHANVYCDRR
jgi:hypothetical protein